MLAVRNFRPDYGRCRPLGIHCTLRGNHLYSTPEVTEEHEIGKQLKHHSACEALGAEKSSCFLEGLQSIFKQVLFFFTIFLNSFSKYLLINMLRSLIPSRSHTYIDAVWLSAGVMECRLW